MAAPTDPTIQHALESFLAAIERRYAAPSVTAYTQAMRLFSQLLREEYQLRASSVIGKLTLEQGASYLKLLQDTRSVETEHLYSRVLLHFFEYCAHEFQIALNPETFATLLDQQRRPKSHAIPTVPVDCIEQIIQFAQAAQPAKPDDSTSERRYLGTLRDKAFLLTLAHSGLRLSEICGLRRQHFIFQEQALQIDAPMTLPLAPSTASTITTYLHARSTLDNQQRSVDLPLFARHDKRAGIRVLPISRWTGANIVQAWSKQALDPAVRAALDAAHQYITPHTFRHYFVMKALQTTENDVRTTQGMARHADRSTTRRYVQKLLSEQSTETATPD